jgi:hypothetical protein
MATTATTEPTTVGAFTYDPITSTVSGPADYMRSADYAECIAGITNGTSHTFRACVEHSPTPEIALLVTIQTNYAGWHGMETFNRARGL